MVAAVAVDVAGDAERLARRAGVNGVVLVPVLLQEGQRIGLEELEGVVWLGAEVNAVDVEPRAVIADRAAAGPAEQIEQQRAT